MDASSHIASLTRERNCEIELLRIVLAVMVVCFHAEYLVGVPVCKSGFMAVDAFFMLSGYLMMAHARRTDSLEPLPFLWRRARTFLPETFLASLIGCAVVFFATGCGWKGGAYTLFQSLLKDVFLLKMTGLVPRECDANGVTWYLSSLMMGMALLYPCVRRWGVPLFVPVLSLLLLGYVMHEESAIGKAYEWRVVTYVGNFRALAELGLGAFACSLVSALSPVLPCYARRHRALMWGLPLLKYAALAFALVIAWHGGNIYNQAYFMMAMWLFIVLSFANVGPGFHHPVALFLGRFSLPLYLGHIFRARNLGNMLPADVLVPSRLILYFSFSALTSLLLLYAATALRKHVPRCRC